MAETRMVEEKAHCNLKLEEMIKEVRKNVTVTLTNEDGNKNHSVQGNWQGQGQDQREGTGRRTARPQTSSTPGWTRRSTG